MDQQQRSKKRKSSDLEVEEGEKQLGLTDTSANGKKPKISKSASAAATTSSSPKKLGSSRTTTASTTTNTQAQHDEKDESGIVDDYKPLSLRDIRNRLFQLCGRVPSVPSDGLDAKNPSEIRQWAGQLQAVLEEFNLLVCCISTATYKWGTDRSGAADQHLALLSGELAASQDQISSTVTPRLTNVLAPVVDLVVDRIITTKTNVPADSSSLLATIPTMTTTTTPGADDTTKHLHSHIRKVEDGSPKTTKGYDTGTDSTEQDHHQFAIATSNDAVLVEVKQNIFDRKFVDDDFLTLCYNILSRNAPLLRQVVLANFHKLRQCLADYMDATQKDSNVESSRGFAY